MSLASACGAKLAKQYNHTHMYLGEGDIPSPAIHQSLYRSAQNSNFSHFWIDFYPF